MKNIKSCVSLFFYGFLGLIVISCLLYQFLSSKHFSQSPDSSSSLCILTNVPEKLVTLKGKLILRLFPGPPEYSFIKDGDRADYCWVLKLDEASFLIAIETPVVEPANVLDSITKRAHPDEILLVLDESMENFCQKYQDQEVLSGGYLFYAHTVHHYTPILMDVKNLKVTGI